MRALGGTIWYLQHCLVDKELLSMRKFAVFQPPDENIQLKESSTVKQQNMVRKFFLPIQKDRPWEFPLGSRCHNFVQFGNSFE